MKNLKQVILLRKDLKMGAGKAAAQAAHASLGCLINSEVLRADFVGFDPTILKWMESGQKKVCLRVDSEEELLKVYKKIKNDTNIPYSLIEDSGKTEFHGISTITALGIGPGYEDDIDELTKHLKLY